MHFRTINDDVKINAIEAIRGLVGVHDIKITKHKKDRTLSQNKLMWMWIGIIATETGHTSSDLHEIFKLKFLGTERIEAVGYSFEIPRSTTKLNTHEFTDYIDKIEVLARSIGINLPHPEDLYYEAMK